MVFVLYGSATQFSVVQMSLQGHSLPSICNTLGYSVSPQSLYQWKDLYEITHSVIRNPEEYKSAASPASSWLKCVKNYMAAGRMIFKHTP
ncbi:hypothetical protein VP01_4149g1 [Puccinia sorghi]|uniref:Uncharacterized protein n=1 Tax=Puccinia sorghi TaxID=27349 RepID=A0A0L6URW4_9BASI|nr:hypothetical protein VP01_4149g1 [Puccinia sorghi]